MGLGGRWRTIRSRGEAAKADLDLRAGAPEAQQSTIAPIEYQRLQAELGRQVQLLAAAQTRGQQQVDRALGTALARVITRTACSAVFERDQSYGWNNAMDITAAVTGEMDTILPEVTLP